MGSEGQGIRPVDDEGAPIYGRMLAYVQNDRGRGRWEILTHKREEEMHPECEMWDECRYDEELDEYFTPEGWYIENPDPFAYDFTFAWIDGWVARWLPLPEEPSND